MFKRLRLLLCRAYHTPGLQIQPRLERLDLQRPHGFGTNIDHVTQAVDCYPA